ncbi:hypothetical protein AcW1_000196 [Taiwanofungus camphoratus]|nr:hypothetical protein AcW2_001311 [Antrodia cinnamomea]KAI0935769.1 hypothetical protein AcV5_004094 [Antrodia cinnamomea]KAI0962987.1 hypothetical protein AcW1_000196 [Antrodia cinnamomea]
MYSLQSLPLSAKALVGERGRLDPERQSFHTVKERKRLEPANEWWTFAVCLSQTMQKNISVHLHSPAHARDDPSMDFALRGKAVNMPRSAGALDPR